MKRIAALLLMTLLLLSACRPADNEPIRVGTEDGGGTGYGNEIKSVLELRDFYSIVSGSTRENNLLMLGTPFFVLGESDTYILRDGSQIVLTYNSKGVLSDTLYTEFETGLSYSLFDKLVQLGVLRGTQNNDEPQPDTPSGGNDTPSDTPSGTPDGSAYPMFSARTYRRASFEGKLSLYIDRNTVLSTIGSPNYFRGRNYQKDSYIVDCYVLDDGNVLLLDYGYDRINLRAAAIQGADGITSKYLGSWSVQSKPADFIRRRISLSSVTALKKGTAPNAVYEKLGEPSWLEGTAAQHRDAFVLESGDIVYLTYDDARAKLTAAHRQTAEGQLLEVSLR